MKKPWLKYVKNKFVLASIIFLGYTLFLDEIDLFTLLKQRSKLSELNADKEAVQKDLDEVQSTLRKLRYKSEAERFAREKKFFKKDDEDIFVISYE